MSRIARLWPLALVLLAAGASPLQAQTGASPWDPRGGLAVGSEEERYLRVLQISGMAPLYPWTVRGFTAAEVAGLLPREGVAHPWGHRASFAPDTIAGDAWGWVLPEAGVVYNTGFPYGENDGPVWAGKGLTGSVSGGIWARWGRVHAVVAPQLFWAQNAAFDLAETGRSGDAALWDPLYGAWGGIDRPQRFGTGGYLQLAPAFTEVTVDLGGATAGVSTSGQWWGPATRYPLLLGNNAGGFPRAFVQTARPVGLGFARIHGRMEWARLDQSAQSPVEVGEQRRFASAAILVVQPYGLDGLELGVARFAEEVWPEGGVGVKDLFRPFSGGISTGTNDGVNETSENQLASIFFRWAFPSAGFEFYGEVLKDDFHRDLRHFITNMDDLAILTFGLQKNWQADDGRIWVMRGESVSGEFRHSERGNRLRDGRLTPRPTAPYQHYAVSQGHTFRGQLLASPGPYGGSAWTLGGDLYHPEGRWGVEFRRALRLDWLPPLAGPAGTNYADVLYTVAVDGAFFRDGREISVMVAPTYELNRNLVQGSDAFNLNIAVSVRGLPR